MAVQTEVWATDSLQFGCRASWHLLGCCFQHMEITITAQAEMFVLAFGGPSRQNSVSDPSFASDSFSF